jgi:hypothetical protein
LSTEPETASPAKPTPPVQLGPVTHRRHGIIQKKVRTDGTIAWSSILAKQAANKSTAEPRDYKEVIRPFCITILYHNLLLFIDIFHI